ncbi:aldo/keto reductase [Clostridia bacterium]|nr:aldo/keto reductase [Clostridia bacterium]
MQYRIDKKSGKELSVLGFGCMRFARGISGKIDLQKAEKLIVSAIESGVNYFDTAYIYSGSEEIVGEILHKNKLREKIFLATKLPFSKCKVYEDFERLFQEQLSRLQTDYIDYYLIHNLPTTALWQGLCTLGIEKWIAEKKASGQIKNIGYSFHGAQDQFLALLDLYDWDFCQIQYNYMNEHYQAGTAGLLAANKKGLPVIIMEPLLGGKLATGLPKKAEQKFRETDGKYSNAAWGFRWLWNQPQVSVVLSGMNSEEQLLDNVKVAQEAVPDMLVPQELAAYERVQEIFREAYKIPCTGCNYCMPCPKGVNIPASFAAYNASYANDFVTGMMQYMTSTAINHKNHNSSGHNCIKCGACEQKCPQHIPIIASLEKVTKRMEPFWVRGIIAIANKVMR